MQRIPTSKIKYLILKSLVKIVNDNKLDENVWINCYNILTDIFENSITEFEIKETFFKNILPELAYNNFGYEPDTIDVLKNIRHTPNRAQKESAPETSQMTEVNIISVEIINAPDETNQNDTEENDQPDTLNRSIEFIEPPQCYYSQNTDILFDIQDILEKYNLTDATMTLQKDPLWLSQQESEILEQSASKEDVNNYLKRKSDEQIENLYESKKTCLLLTESDNSSFEIHNDEAILVNHNTNDRNISSQEHKDMLESSRFDEEKTEEILETSSRSSYDCKVLSQNENYKCDQKVYENNVKMDNVITTETTKYLRAINSINELSSDKSDLLKDKLSSSTIEPLSNGLERKNGTLLVDFEKDFMTQEEIPKIQQNTPKVPEFFQDLVIPDVSSSDDETLEEIPKVVEDVVILDCSSSDDETREKIPKMQQNTPKVPEFFQDLVIPDVSSSDDEESLEEIQKIQENVPKIPKFFQDLVIPDVSSSEESDDALSKDNASIKYSTSRTELQKVLDLN